MMSAASATAEQSAPSTRPVLIAMAIGLAVALALGVYGGLHTPGRPITVPGFSTPLAFKAWLTSLAFLFGLVQLFSALAIFGRIPVAGAWVAPLHRWSGRIAVIITLPVAFLCLYSLGFRAYDARVLVHSLFGCFFYGAFVAKIIIVKRTDAPGWAVPVLGGAVFSALTALWLTAAVWFFTTFGVTL